MTSERAKIQTKEDITDFFGPFCYGFPQEQREEGLFRFGVGTIGNVPGMREIYAEVLDRIRPTLLSSFGRYPGTQGYMPLNEILAELLTRETGCETKPEQIILTNGGYDAINQAIFGYTGMEGRVAFATPSFPYWPAVRRNACRWVALDFPDAEAYRTGLGEEVARRIASGTRLDLLILNAPHNPLGVFPADATLTEVGRLAESKGFSILLDEVYRAFSHRKRPWVGAALPMDRTIVIDSISKRFGLPTLRLGYLRVAAEDVPPLRAGIANEVIGINLMSAIFAHGLIETLLERDALDLIPREIARRHHLLEEGLRPVRDFGVRLGALEGGIFRLLDVGELVERTGKSVDELVEFLRERDLEVVAARLLYPVGFQGTMAPVIRLSVGSESRIEAGSARLCEAFETLWKTPRA